MKELEILRKIERVSPPPFLLTRIKAQVAKKETAPISWSWTISIAAPLIFLLVLNFQTVQSSVQEREHAPTRSEAILQSMNLNESIQLYHD